MKSCASGFKFKSRRASRKARRVSRKVRKSLRKASRKIRKVSRKLSRKVRKSLSKASRKIRRASRKASRKSRRASRKSRRASRKASRKSKAKRVSKAECVDLYIYGKTASERKKYGNRDAPPYSANAAGCQGIYLVGNDGKGYKSVENAKGIFVWRKV